MAPGARTEGWAVEVGVLLQLLASTPLGLSPEEAARRLARHGPNELPEPRRRSLARALAAQVGHFMALLLWAAAALAFASGTPELGWAIVAVVVVNAAFSGFQEQKAERALSALQRRLPADTRAYRGGRLAVVPARDLVPGDVLELREGDRVSADARLLASDLLRLDLSLLTGESAPADRAAGGAEPGARLAEAAGVVLAGSSVVGGWGRALVYATGRDTALGQVAGLTAEIERIPSTLSTQVARVVRVITVLAVGMGVAVFVLARLLVGVEWHAGLLFAIGIIVANVPEGLLPTITLALALGVQRMARRRVLVRRMPALETLSAVTVVCTDKTGTLTTNAMTVREVWLPGRGRAAPGGAVEGAVQRLLGAAALCTEAGAAAEGALEAPPRDGMEAALVEAARAGGVDLAALVGAAPRLRELPFDPARRMMTAVVRWAGAEAWRAGGPLLAITKGGPAEVLARCDRAQEGDRAVPLGEEGRRQTLAEAEALAAAGHRMLAVAFRAGEEELARDPAEAVERGLVLLGLLAILDPPRPGVAHAIQTCRRAGITVTMVTGDHAATAEAVAREVGLVRGKAVVVSGAELERLDEAHLLGLLQAPRDLVFARVLPDQKLRLVRAYQALGHVVAVTGDGVNDAPALRAAHVGIAMGASGTDVARSAADLVLLDDDFGSFAAAVEEGRALYQNVRKFLAYILTSNVPEIAPYLAMVALRVPPALGILQILAVDLGTDMLPALALGGEPPEPGLMERPPRPREARLLDRKLLARAYLRLGVVQAVASMGAFFVVLAADGVGLGELRALAPAIIAGTADPPFLAAYRHASTAALAAIVASQAANLFACRSERGSALRLPRGNALLGLGLFAEFGLLAAIVYLPPLQRVFGTSALGPAAWAALLAGPALLLLVDEAAKWRARRRGRP